MSYVPIKSKPVYEPLLETKQAIESTDGANEFKARFYDMWRNTFAGSAFSEAELFFNRFDSDRLSAEEANAQYGIEGILNFDKPIGRSEARLRQFRMMQAKDRDAYIAKEAQTENFLEKVGNVGIGLGTLATDPVNYIPFFKLAKGAGLVKAAKAGSTWHRVSRNPILAASFDGFAGNLVTAPLVARNYHRQGLEYSVNDALIDLGAGGLFGGIFGAVGLGFKVRGVKNLRQKRLATYAALKDMEAAFGHQKTALKEQFTAEDRAVMDELIQVIQQRGGEVDADTLAALGKLRTSLNRFTKSNSTEFLNEFLMRNDFKNMTPEVIEGYLMNAINAELIPTNVFADLGKSFAFLEQGRLNELPQGWSSIVQKLGNQDGFISIRSFLESFNELEKISPNALKNKEVKAFVESITGVKNPLPETVLNAKQAAALFDEFDKLARQRRLQKRANLVIKEEDLDVTRRRKQERFQANQQERLSELETRYKDLTNQIEELESQPVEVSEKNVLEAFQGPKTQKEILDKLRAQRKQEILAEKQAVKEAIDDALERQLQLKEKEANLAKLLKNKEKAQVDFRRPVDEIEAELKAEIEANEIEIGRLHKKIDSINEQLNKTIRVPKDMLEAESLKIEQQKNQVRQELLQKENAKKQSQINKLRNESDNVFNDYDRTKRSIEDLMRKQRDTLATRENVLSDILEFQQALKKAESNTQISFTVYKKKFDRLFKFIKENPNLRKLTVAELKDLDETTRAELIDFIKFFQEANPSQRLLTKVFNGDKTALQEMYEQARFNSQMKDKFTEQQAYDIINKEITRDYFKEEQISQQELLGYENLKLSESGEIDIAYYKDQVELAKAELDEKSIKTIEASLEKEAIQEDSYAEALAESIKCGRGGI